MTETPDKPLPQHVLPPLVALQFLTRLPVPEPGRVADAVVGRSLLWYPLVGLLLGALLWGGQLLLQWLLPDQVWLQAALLLSAWCLITGGLHLDGLADSADAWVGGFGDRERTLRLMKDPTCGPAAVMLLVMLLLVKFGALVQLLHLDSAWLLVVPLIGRALLLLLFLTTDYVRPQGLGTILAEQFNRRQARLLLVLLAILLPLSGWPALMALACALLLFVGLRRLMQQRLGGTTGDTAGALVELSEAAALIGILIALPA
ncbi:adenosylcobinamide-GDP ribazoletransferase [Motiliproteus coralliicola]|uniref:Adenosylcobinamide-GDP ribazoletransferase n=1 Tax=Motiliproteus coralliicola TaxID=2283196 RepID=A0A369WQ00_9GAMM|nr:adenosylcobinamide-GDP ribazoletransferase [Motiliproteus coralliicola]RDE22646.1 adenosylcobinamide-GDP ribazoletransferase [Motiliproteus coralliicola]